MNLKGKIEEAYIKKAVYDLSWDITEMMMNVKENKEMACMLDQIQLCHVIKQSWKLPLQYIVELIHYWIPAVVSILSFLTLCCFGYVVITLSCYNGLVVGAFKVVIITSCFDCSSKLCAMAMVFYSNEIFSAPYPDKSK